MLTNITAANFRQFKGATLPLSRFTLLIGPCGAGKTNALLMTRDSLRAIESCLSERPFRREEIHPAMWEHDFISSLANLYFDQGTKCLGVTFKSSSEFGYLDVEVAHSAFAAASSKASFLPETKAAEWAPSWKSALAEFPYFLDPKNWIRVPRCAFLSLRPNEVSESVNVHEAIKPRNNETGGGVVPALVNSRLTDPTLFESVSEDLKQVVPEIETMGFRRASIDEVATALGDTRRPKRDPRGSSLDHHELEFTLKNGVKVPASRMSEGTLLTLAILTHIQVVGDSDFLLLIDDIDRGLHPSAIAQLMRAIKRLQELHPKLQIIATTHSPYVMDELKPEDVLVLNLNAEGHTVCKRLSEHPRMEDMSRFLSTGEAWSSVGEDWVIGQ